MIVEIVVDGEPMTISYTDVGAGEAVLFLHALGRSAQDWVEVVEDLSTSYRCVAIDLPGHGASSRAERYSFEMLADATGQFIDQLGLGPVTIVAHSMGATTAWVLAPDLGPKLRALVIEDTTVPSDRHEYPDIPEAPPEPVGYDWLARRQLFAALNRPDPAWRRRLPAITPALLLVMGRHEDEDLDDTMQLVPHAEVVEIPVGHWVHQEATVEFTSAVRRFLERAHQTSQA